jgi:hypothetical protein
MNWIYHEHQQSLRPGDVVGDMVVGGNNNTIISLVALVATII